MPARKKSRTTWLLIALRTCDPLGPLAILAPGFRRLRPHQKIHHPHRKSRQAAAIIGSFPFTVGGRTRRRLIKLAYQLGFNGVQFQIEGSNELGIRDFAERDAQEHLVDYCHSLGMQVTLWVHELSDLPGAWMPEYPGAVAESNDKLWKILEDRYEWILTKAVPNVDGLALTVVETQVRASRHADHAQSRRYRESRV